MLTDVRQKKSRNYNADHIDLQSPEFLNFNKDPAELEKSQCMTALSISIQPQARGGRQAAMKND